jgi:RNA polymerase sigma-70 factor (ECF subfamily)
MSATVAPIDVTAESHADASASARPAAPPSFQPVYDAQVDFVWRSARRLGVPEAAVEDVVQDVFVVVHRRLSDYDGRVTLKAWIFGIVVKVVGDHRRRFRRKWARCVAYDEAAEGKVAAGTDRGRTPQAMAEQSEALRLLHALLDTLDDGKRQVLVLAQLEEMSVPEIAECLGLNVNTASARLRAARKAFAEAHARHRARTEGRRP